jgi:hypothetical protein
MMTDRVTVRVDDSLIRALDRCREELEPKLRTRQDLVRYILADWLTTRSYLSGPFKERHDLISGSAPE